ncbi:HAMP domain-containing sensor histidine kinase [Lysinibacillus capsici]
MIALLHFLDIFPQNSMPPQFKNDNTGFPFFPLFAFSFFCILLGTALTIFFSKKALNPLRQVIDAIHQVANGEFTTKVDVKGVVELEELSTSFNKMTKELANIETLRSDFINNFSHELKTPIVSIRGFAKLLKNQNLTQDEREEYLDIILIESERLASLSTNLLTLSKYENLDIIPEKVPFRLDEQIRRTIVILEPKWSAKQLTMEVELESLFYHGNADLMAHIWLNLIDNAIKFSLPEGTIFVRLTKTNEGIQFSVKDQGIGMDEETIQRIFEKFYQGDSSHSSLGYGIGLALVARLVKLCEGSITIHSKPDKGSIFTAVLPNKD